MKTSRFLLLIFLAFSAAPVYAGPPPQPGNEVLSQYADSWTPVKLRATQSLTLPKNHPKLKALAARTQKDLEAIDGTMTQIAELKSSKRPNKDVARRSLEQLRQHQVKLRQTERELATIGKSLSGRKTDKDRVRQKQDEVLQAMADAEIEEAKDNYEDAREQLKQALRIIQEHIERETQVVQKITS